MEEPRFAAQAAHDLQEPLRLLSGYLDLLCAHLDGKAKIDGPRLAHEAKDTADRMQRMVSSLLDYTRVGTSRTPMEPVPLAAALGDAMANLRLRMRETGAEVTHGPLPTVLGDRAQLTRVFQNLIENSVKYAHGRSAVLHVTAQPEEKGWLVLVDDNGPGWPLRGRDKLFEPFARLDPAAAPGSGLGLATVRGILARHGGEATAADAPAGGARVALHFPRMEGA